MAVANFSHDFFVRPLREPIGNRHSLLQLMDVLGILIGPQRVLVRFGELRKDLREVTVEGVEARNTVSFLEGDLLFEQRVQDDRCAPRIFETLDLSTRYANGEAPAMKWVFETHAQIRRLGLHGDLLSCFGAASTLCRIDQSPYK